MENTQQTKEEKSEGSYWVWAFLTGIIVFISVWIYAMSEWGFLLGIVFGWFPAIIAAFIAGILWPLIALAIVGILVVAFS
jgi:hypothetical protein